MKNVIGLFVIVASITVPIGVMSNLLQRHRLSEKQLIVLTTIFMTISMPIVGIVMGVSIEARLLLVFLSLSGFGMGLQGGRVIVGITRKEREAKERLERSKESQPDTQKTG